MRNVVLSALFLSLGAHSALASETVVEFGDIGFHRDFEVAVEAARASDKPLLILFTEVPGCHTVTTYGQEVLRHPLIVDAAEQLFVPVAVRNNVRGWEREVLSSFEEPTWNNPVVRIVDAERKPLAPRLAGDYTVGGLASAMVSALDQAGRSVPEYLRLLAWEGTVAEPATAALGMYCFWSGEAGIGAIDGVLKTRPGFAASGGEGVLVRYDPARVSYEDLLRQAWDRKAASKVLARSAGEAQRAQAVVGRRRVKLDRGAFRASDKDLKYSLRANPLRFVPMTEAQAAKVNSALASGDDPLRYLSPSQRSLHASVLANPTASWRSAIGAPDLQAAFGSALDVSARAKAGA